MYKSNHKNNHCATYPIFSYNKTMEITQNLHTHSQFCDGKDTLEENVIAAIEKGLDTIGFSSHYPPNHDPASIEEKDVPLYFEQLASLEKKYKGKIRILKGLELENINTSSLPLFHPESQYFIGSVHQFLFGDTYISVDSSPEIFRQALDRVEGNIFNLIENYYSQVVEFSSQPYTINGHFDLITKFNEKFNFFDENSRKYRDIALNAVEEVAKNGKIFELNTGAISRGWKTTPYPAVFILKRLKEMNVPVIVSSDSHSKENITFGFDYCKDLLDYLGFKSVFTF